MTTRLIDSGWSGEIAEAQQQAAVELSSEGFAWLSERLQAAFDRHGKVPPDDLDKLDRPQVS